MTARPLSLAMRNALLAMLKAPITRGRHVALGDGWIAQDGSFHAPVVVRSLVQRGLVAPPMKLAVLTIAGRKQAQQIGREAA